MSIICKLFQETEVKRAHGVIFYVITAPIYLMNIDSSFQQVGSKPNLHYKELEKWTVVYLGNCFVYAQEKDLVFWFWL